MLKRIPEKGMERFPLLLEKVENGLFNMQRIINDLTDSRLKEHRYQAVEELLNFEHIIEDVRLTLAPQIEDSKAIYRAVERRPEIIITTEREANFMVISIADNGNGIAEKDLPSIFASIIVLLIPLKARGLDCTL